MSKNPFILVLTVAALANFTAVAATDTDTKIMQHLIKNHITTVDEVVETSAEYEAQFDEVTTALRVGGSETTRAVNGLSKLKALQVKLNAAAEKDGLFGAVANITGGDALIDSYVADMTRLYFVVESTLLAKSSINKLGAKRFTVANDAIVSVKKRFSTVRKNLTGKKN